MPRTEYAARDLYDVWFPNLAPSEALLKASNPAAGTGDWRLFERRFRAEMKSPWARRDLDLLAALSHGTNFSLGCYCADESRCHRSVLKALLTERGASLRADD